MSEAIFFGRVPAAGIFYRERCVAVSGFNNVSYFNRQFKWQVGGSPLYYRRQR